jgi:hypothetical protein
MAKIRSYLLVILTIFCLSSVSLLFTVEGQVSFSVVNVNTDGSIDPFTAPIRINGNVYTLTDNISGRLVIHRSNIIVDGNGYSLIGNGDGDSVGINLSNNVTQVPSNQEIWNVTVENLKIINFNYSIQTNGGGNNTFYNDYIANTIEGLRGGVFFWGCQRNTITHCDISGQPAIFFDFCSSNNNVTNNNLSGGVWVQLSGNETVDSNYWSDYSTKYPNASKIDSTGTWSTPYEFLAYENSTVGTTQDNHPRVNPFDFSTDSQSKTANQQSTATPELSWLVFVPLLLSVFAVAVIVRHRKTAKISQ